MEVSFFLLPSIAIGLLHRSSDIAMWHEHYAPKARWFVRHKGLRTQVVLLNYPLLPLFATGVEKPCRLYARVAFIALYVDWRRSLDVGRCGCFGDQKPWFWGWFARNWTIVCLSVSYIRARVSARFCDLRSAWVIPWLKRQDVIASSMLSTALSRIFCVYCCFYELLDVRYYFEQSILNLYYRNRSFSLEITNSTCTECCTKRAAVHNTVHLMAPLCHTAY